MSTTPAVTTIYDEIEARGGNITLTNGYNTDVQKVERSTLSPFTGGDWPKFSFWPVDVLHQDDGYGQEQHTLRIIVGYFDLTRDEKFADLAAKLEADAITALNRTTAAPAISDAANYDLNGLVESMHAARSEFHTFEGQEPWCGVLVEFIIKYRSAMADAFSIET